MKEIKVDVAVIGAGTAGLNARRAAEKAGAKVLLISRPPHGTTCARVGCMPSKLLIAAAEAAYHVQKASLFGLRASLKVNGGRVLERVQKKRDWFVSFVQEDVRTLLKRKKMLEGHAELLSPDTLQVKATRIRAKTVVFATGTSAWIPPEYRDCEDLLFTNETIFEMKRLPESLLVVGTGMIGLELGQALHRLGVRVMLLGHRHRIRPLSDPFVLRAAHRIFAEDLDLYPHYRLNKIDRTPRGIRIRFRDPSGKRRTGEFKAAFIGAGRRPHLDRELLERFGVRFKENGYPEVDENTARAPGTHFFFAGDVAGLRPVLHEAAREGKIAGRNAALFPRYKPIKRMTPMVIAFTDPEMAVVGKSWEELKRLKIKVAAGQIDYGKQGRAQILGINRGFARIYAEPKTSRILGAEILGPRAEHTAHLLAWAIEKKTTVAEMLSFPFYHPVIEEGIHSALENLLFRMKGRRHPSPDY